MTPAEWELLEKLIIHPRKGTETLVFDVCLGKDCPYNSPPQGDGNLSCGKGFLELLGAYNSPPQGDGNPSAMAVTCGCLMLIIHPRKGTETLARFKAPPSAILIIHPRKGTETVKGGFLQLVVATYNSPPQGDGNDPGTLDCPFCKTAYNSPPQGDGNPASP